MIINPWNPWDSEGRELKFMEGQQSQKFLHRISLTVAGVWFSQPGLRGGGGEGMKPHYLTRVKNMDFGGSYDMYMHTHGVTNSGII